MATLSSIPLSGFVAPGFEPVRDLFAKHFADGRELGAGYFASVDGVVVVDLAGGWANRARTKPFSGDTVTVVYSCGKAVQGMTVAHLVSRGLLEYDAPVAKYWPEFAAGGKEHVTVRDLCQHAAGVPYLDDANLVSPRDHLSGDVAGVAAKLARQSHSHGGKKTKVYHATTQGWYLNEIIRRVTGGLTHGQLLRQLVNPALGIDVFAGFDVTDPRMEERYAEIVPSEKFMKALAASPPKKGSLKLLVARSGPPRTEANDPEIRKSEIPSAFTVTNARSLGKLATLASMGGSLDGFTFIDEKTLRDSCAVDPEMDGVVDLFTDLPTRTCRGGASWSNSLPGYKVPTVVPRDRPEWKGDGWSWTGWMGTGGSHFQWDLTNRVASAYVMNLIEPGWDERGMELAASLVECVEKARAKNVTKGRL
ncbi:beta-lactamase/transpeptidase-like protein [Gonapodya prolifera JEL478]|uniref:Beta-lactamase/transpeptidase-like protein n=1 Tax=Gonapodya prolifera (strain JEL478) TaxID=1344416 RepID=A0A139ADV8_GONPJ|nr:beta-lactamase/transpeptidase-like protein [Gonapodya prolifera JEL478]|eukprot:KXS14625.1 beta-lactamase/transpeptidase-like protein [Gonapodya prolifera JEL478]